jgi:hypothetical protein
MSKFLQNLLVRISKICQKSKLQIKFERILFLESDHFWFSAQPQPTSLPPPSGPAAAHLFPSPFWPSLPHRLPLTDRRAHPLSHPAVFFLRKPNQELPPPPPERATAAPTTPPLPEMVPYSPPLHFQLTPLFPLPTESEGWH